MLITKICLQNWKNFGEVSAVCGKRVFLIGPNASGKSNFLDALRFLRDVASDGLDKAVAARGGMKAIRNLNARRNPEVIISVHLDDAWEYSLSFKSDERGAPCISGETVFHMEDGVREQLLSRPDAEDKADQARLTQTALQQINANHKFRKAADLMASIQYRHILPQLVRDPKSFSPLPSKNDPFGRDIVALIWNAPQKIRDARLRRINEALSGAVPQFAKLAVDLDKKTGLPHLKVNCEHWRTHGAYQDESAFSDGTLRLLALLWSLYETDGPLLLEEPELSLHEEIVRHLPGLFAHLDKNRKKQTRQVFVTTHSWTLLNDKGIGAGEVLRLEPTSNGTRVFEPTEEETRQMTDGALTAADIMLPKTRPSPDRRMALSDMI